MTSESAKAQGAPALDMGAVSRVKPFTGPALPYQIGPLFLDEAGARYAMRQAAQAWEPFCVRFFGHADKLDLVLQEFFETFLPQHQAMKFPEGGGTSVGGLLTVYLIARMLSPTVVVESGTFVGTSLHALRKAAPQAELWSFDVSFRSLRYRDPSIHYVEQDWSLMTDPPARSDHDLCFLDDHIDNAQRIMEAHARGFRFLLFDDAPAFGQITLYRYPGVPTVPMILDPDLGTLSVAWRYNDMLLKYDHEPERCEAARKLIDIAAPVPQIRAALGLHAGDKWLVRLKQ